MSNSLAAQVANVFFYVTYAAPAAIVVHGFNTTRHTQDWLIYAAAITFFGGYGSDGILKRFGVIERRVEEGPARALLHLLLVLGAFFNCLFVLDGTARVSGWLPKYGGDVLRTTVISLFGVIGTTIAAVLGTNALAFKIYKKAPSAAKKE